MLTLFPNSVRKAWEENKQHCTDAEESRGPSESQIVVAGQLADARINKRRSRHSKHSARIENTEHAPVRLGLEIAGCEVGDQIDLRSERNSEKRRSVGQAARSG